MVGKGAQATGMAAALRGLSSKDDSTTWGELHKEWTEAGVSVSRATTHRRVQEMGVTRITSVKSLLNQRQRQKLLI